MDGKAAGRLHPGERESRHALRRGDSNLAARLHQHRTGLIKGFTSRYGVHQLMWFEQHETMEAAIHRERMLKKWNRAWKLALIEERNPHWEDLAVKVLGLEP